MKWLRNLILPGALIAAVLAAGAVAHGGFFQWSTTSDSNATADPTINWSEGQSPSSVNDSARAMMARTAEYRNDVSGRVATGGTSTAYTVTSNQVFTTLALMSGNKIAFVPHTTNAATVTLNVDGLGAKPLRSAPSVELGAGVLVQGSPYVATYNNSTVEWVLQGFFGNPFSVPLGTVLDYTGTSAPNSNFVFAFGQCISRTTYAALFVLTGITYGTCDGSTTFGVPDLRGNVVIGKQDMGGSSANRVTVAGGNFNADTLGNSGGVQNHILSVAEMPAHSHTYTDPGHAHAVSIVGTSTAVVSNTSANVSVPSAPASGVATTTSTSNITINTAGSSAAHPNVQPSIVLNKIIRIF